VKTWITVAGQLDTDRNKDFFTAAYNQIKAHTAAYSLYQNTYKSQGGRFQQSVK